MYEAPAALSGGIVSTASNIRSGNNPIYTLDDFILNYPAFGSRRKEDDETGDNFQVEYLVEPMIIEMYIDLAHACVRQARWKNAWRLAMGWFIMHFLTLYLQSMAKADSPAAAVIAAGQARGVVTSKSVADVSVSYDLSSIAQDLDGWAAWKLTIYGQQLATMGKLVGKGGMYIW